MISFALRFQGGKLPEQKTRIRIFIRSPRPTLCFHTRSEVSSEDPPPSTYIKNNDGDIGGLKNWKEVEVVSATCNFSTQFINVLVTYSYINNNSHPLKSKLTVKSLDSILGTRFSQFAICLRHEQVWTRTMQSPMQRTDWLSRRNWSLGKLVMAMWWD